MRRGAFYQGVEVPDVSTGKKSPHRVVVIQDDELLNAATVLVCPISTKRHPQYHQRLRLGGAEPFTLGLCDPQEGIPDKSYFHIYNLRPMGRKKLAKHELAMLTASNLRSLELALIRVLGLRALLPQVRDSAPAEPKAPPEHESPPSEDS